MSKTIASVTAGSPPETIRTLGEWLAWRRAEDERMVAEVRELIQAHYEREAGVTEH